MAMRVSALAMLLALPSLLCLQDPALPSSSKAEGGTSPEKCRKEGSWTEKVTFDPDETEFPVNAMVSVTCNEGRDRGPFNATCNMTKDYSAAWDISHVKCLRMCNTWAKQVDFSPRLAEFSVGATAWVRCQEPFEQKSFSITCTEMKSGKSEWDFSKNKCMRRCKLPKTWQARPLFSPKRQFYSRGESVVLSCPEGYRPRPSEISCIENGTQSMWSETPSCQEKCQKPTGDPYLRFAPDKRYYAREEPVTLSCREGHEPSQPTIRCLSNGSHSVWSEAATCQRKCQKPEPESRGAEFMPKQSSYNPGDVVTWSCPEGYWPSAPQSTCTTWGTWNETVRCVGVCTRGGNWPPSVSAASSPAEFAVGEQVLVTCLQDQFEEGSFPMTCVEQDGRVQWDTSHVNCTEKCQKPTGDPYLRFAPDKRYYAREEPVTLSCREGYEPSQPTIRCLLNGSHSVWSEAATCQRKCQEPEPESRGAEFMPKQSSYNPGDVVTWSCPEGYWPSAPQSTCTTWGTWNETVRCVEKCREPVPRDSRAEFTPKRPSYSPGDWVTWSCPEGYRPSPANSTCVRSGSRSVWGRTAWCEGFCTLSGNRLQLMFTGSLPTELAVGRSVWVSCRQEQFEGSPGYLRCVERAGRPEWDTSQVRCIEKCRRPHWDPRLQFAPDRQFYRQGDNVKLSCLDGSPPSLPEISCVWRYQDGKNGWAVGEGRGRWHHIDENVICADSPQFITGTPEITPTSIRLGWGCTPANSCLRISAMVVTCLPAGAQANPCQRPADSTGERPGGRAGSLTCSNLQPFTLYNVTISARYGATRSSPSAVVYTQLLRTNETAPAQPQIEPRDPSTGSLRWKQLPSCHGDILGYQLNITAWREYDSSFLEGQVVQVNASVTEYRPPRWRPGTNYMVTVQGRTAAGLGEASQWAFETEISDPDIPSAIRSLSIRDDSQSGMAVLPLRPVPELHGPIQEYQIIVTVGPNGSGADDCLAWDLQPFNASQGHKAYVAAVVPAHNLTGPMDFVLGDGVCSKMYCNARLHPGQNYTALVRVVSRWKQVEKASCVRYDFSVGTGSTGEPLSRAVVLAVVAAVLVLLVAMAVLVLLSRRKRKKSKDHESNGTIPLRRNRAGASKLNTQILVPELLETLKRFRRAEMAAEEEAEEDTDLERPKAGCEAEYQKLDSGLLHACDAGKEPCNQGKNRYKNIIPYDHARVVLRSAEPSSDYINASYVDSYRSPRFFIAAQGPLQGTVEDFWQMIWQEKTSVIVMLTDLVEQNKTKCEQYWPEQEQEYRDFTVMLSNTRMATSFITRTFRLQKAGCPLPRLVEQLHYQQWPDHGVPRNPAQLLRLVETVNKKVSEASGGPVVVHCSAGIGRTGTFIALDTLLKMARAEGKVDVFQCVQKLREQRVSMVQTKEQYAFLYEVLLEGLLCSNTGVPVESFGSPVSHLKELDPQTQTSRLMQEFKALQKFSELFQLSASKEAEKPSNQPKNRKPTILPDDRSRPILMSSLKLDGSPGYINAVFVSTYTEDDRVIVTQLPLKETVVDFWALLWDYTCTSLVLLNRIEELDQTYLEFWPSYGEAIYGRFHVTLISEEPGAGFTIRTLAVANKQQPKKAVLEVKFWQLDDWPMQQELPPCPTTIISLLGEVERTQRQNQDSHVLVTCWDGASRCGLFCAAGFLCEQIRSEGLVDVSQAVRMLKRQRRQLVKDVNQYEFCYKLALSYLDSFKIYGNFK